MTLNNIIDKLLEETPFSPQRSEREQLDSPAAPFVGVLSARAPHLKRSAAVPEPMFSWCWNHRDPFVAKRRVQIEPPNSFQELLLQKPFLHPYEGSVIVLHRNHHGGLVDGPMPEAFWHSTQPHAHSTDNHQQKPAGGEFVPAAQYTFQNLEHIHFSNRHNAGILYTI